MSRILLGVTGGIAAYKAVNLLRHLQNAGHDVRVVMTPNATRFVAPLTFQALTQYPVFTDGFESGADPMHHITLAKWADIFVIAPATAGTIAKIALGIADNLLTSLFLVTTAKVFVFPAMNGNMYKNPSVQANIHTLKARGIRVEEPDEGALACGDTAIGRLPEPECMAAVIHEFIHKEFFMTGLRVLVTAGPTVEAIDPVRYISNRSSGKMGYAVAEAAQSAGGEVILISGPVNIPPPVSGTVYVKNAADMLKAVRSQITGCDIFIMAAAVADYTPSAPASQKIKKTDEALVLTLVKTEDILKTVSSGKQKHQVFVGFAAESEDVAANALQKLKGKNLDLVIANDISRGDIGFDSPDNEVVLYYAGGESKVISKRPKKEVALCILEAAVKIFQQKTADEKK